jgi:hypothetical protein
LKSIKKIFLTAVLVSLPITFTIFANENEHRYSGDILPQKLISIYELKGQELVSEEDYSSFFPLTSYFVTENDVTYCGIASSVMLLNVLNFDPPITPMHAPYKIFNQENIFYNEDVMKIISPMTIQREGATLDQITNLLKVFAPKVKRTYCSDSSLEEFKRSAIEAIRVKNKGIIINFCRETIGEIGCGHFSPLAAYNKKEDCFLLLDVARYKYPPVWIKSEDLFNAMNTKDSSSDKTRGYIIIEN